MDYTVLVLIPLGLALGSFANVVIFRMGRWKSIIQEPSHCPHCRHRLAWYDLVPVLSYLLLSGRCRYCQTPIGLQYPLVEAATALGVLLLYNAFGISWAFAVYTLLLVGLVILFVYDLNHMVLPDAVVLPGIGLAVAGYFFRESFSLASVANMGAGLAVALLILGGLYVLGRGRWLGFGDVKYGLLMGTLLGWPAIVLGLTAAFFMGALVSALLLALRLKSFRSEVPFGPFLVLGTLLALLWGQDWLLVWQRAFL